MPEIEIRSTAARIAFTLLVLAILAPGLYLAICICMAEYPVRTKGGFDSYSRAIQFDPASGEYW